MGRRVSPDPLLDHIRHTAGPALDALRGRAVVVGLSGGADSRVLLHALSLLAPELAITLHPAHLDHALRPESGQEQLELATTVRELGLELTCARLDVRSLAEEERLSIEAAARAARYRFLAEQARARGGALAVAHNRTDQAETVLLALARGAGPSGLTGMRQAGAVPYFADVPLVRPLLTVDAEDVRAYARRHGLPVWEDPSNASPAFRRNIIRHEVLPALLRVNSAAVKHIAQAADLLRAEEDVLDALPDLPRWTVFEHGYAVPLRALADAPRALALRAIRHGLRAAAGTPEGFTARHLRAVLSLAAAGRGQSELHLPHGLRAVVHGGSLILTADVRLPGSPYAGPLVGGDCADLEAGWWWVARRVPPEDHGLLGDGGLHEHVRWSEGRLSLRPAALVPRVRPLGRSRDVPTVDFLARQGVPGDVRRRVPVVMLGSSPVWLMGVRICDEWKVTGREEVVWCLRAGRDADASESGGTR